MKLTILLAFAISVSVFPCSAQSGAATHDSNSQNAKAAAIDPGKEADIRQLMALTGAGKLGVQAMTNMAGSQRSALEQMLPPGEYRGRLVDLFFEKFFGAATEEALVNIAIPIYDRHFSDEEIKGLIVFYQSPLGQKTISAMPQVVSESQQAGGDWGKQLGRKCMQDVLAEHPDLEKALNDAQKASSPR